MELVKASKINYTALVKEIKMISKNDQLPTNGSDWKLQGPIIKQKNQKEDTGIQFLPRVQKYLLTSVILPSDITVNEITKISSWPQAETHQAELSGHVDNNSHCN